MNRLLTIAAVIISMMLSFSCKKDHYQIADNIALKTFSLEPGSNPGLTKSIHAVIEGKEVYIRIPNAIDIKNAIPSFTTNSDKIVGFVGKRVIESGVSTLDLSNPVVFRLNSPDGLSEFHVTGLKSAAVLSFGFYAADNEGKLFKDYPAVISKLSIAVDLPVDADVNNLVARYTTTDGATVKYKGATFVSGTTAVDYNQVVELELMDTDMEQPEVFQVTVGRLTAPVWSRVILPAFAQVDASSAKLEINPVTKQPYIMFQRSGSQDSLRKAILLGFDASDNKWFNVGPESGFSASRVSDVSFSFDNNGIIYAAYKDYDAGDRAQNASVQKFTDNKWQYVGGQQGSHDRVNVLSSQVDKYGKPYLSYALARAASPFANRAAIVESYSTTWNPGVYSAIGDAVFTKLIKGQDDNLYLLLMPRTNRKPSILKLDNGTWSPVGGLGVGTSFANAAAGLDIDADVTENGEVYLTYQAYEGTTYITYVMHWNGTKWQQLGDGIPAVLANSTGNRNNIAVKVHPDGRVFFAYGDGGLGLNVTTYNKETGNWNTAVKINNGSDKYEMRISNQGVPYLVTITDGKVALYKYDIPGQ